MSLLPEPSLWKYRFENKSIMIMPCSMSIFIWFSLYLQDPEENSWKGRSAPYMYSIPQQGRSLPLGVGSAGTLIHSKRIWNALKSVLCYVWKMHNVNLLMWGQCRTYMYLEGIRSPFGVCFVESSNICMIKDIQIICDMCTMTLVLLWFYVNFKNIHRIDSAEPYQFVIHIAWIFSICVSARLKVTNNL